MTQTPPQTTSQAQKPEEVVGVIPELTTWLWGGPPSECMEAIELFSVAKFKMKRVALLNAFVLPKRPMVVITMPTNIENVKSIIQRAENIGASIESYIGHEATAKMLSELLGIQVEANRAEYEPQVGDIAVITRLKKRLQTPQDLKDIKVEDLEFHVANYNNAWVLGWE
jgi:hypothetical protein